MDIRIRIEILENGFEVTIPDVEAYKKAEDAAKAKQAKAKSGEYVSMPYCGDYEKSYAAKTPEEVLSLIKPTLKKLPQSDFEAAFKEATAEGEDDDY